MLRHSLSSKLSFRLLIHCNAICIANGAAARNSDAAVSSSPPLPHFRSPLGAPVCFLSLVPFSSFILIHFDVLYSMQVFHTLSSGHSQPNKLNATHGGSSAHSNHPNNGGGDGVGAA
jgi:hypothetical protein